MQITLPQLPQDKKIFIIGGGVILVLLLLVLFMQRGANNAARPDQSFNIPAFGTLPPLAQAMRNNAKVNASVQRLLSYDEAFIFVNYQQVNQDMATLLFAWAGLTDRDLQTLGGQGAIAVFLRRAYGMPDDEPIMGNPLLEGNPWGDLLSRFKSQILMQGQAYKIFDGLAYYDNEQDRMMIEANISENFVEGFTEFLNTQTPVLRRKYVNNFLLFLRDTIGLKNLSAEDQEKIKTLKGTS